MNLIVAARVNQCTQKATLSGVQLLLQLLLHPAVAVAPAAAGDVTISSSDKWVVADDGGA